MSRKNLLVLVLLITLSFIFSMGCRLDDNRLRGRIKSPSPAEETPLPYPIPTEFNYLIGDHYLSGEELNIAPDVLAENADFYTINPDLPLGLNFDSSTGAISGTLPPLVRTAYSVTAHGPGGTTSTELELESFFYVSVNSTEDEADDDPEDGLCDAGSAISGANRCSLRAALDQANALAPLKAIIEIPPGDYLLSSGERLTISTNIEVRGAGPGADPANHSIIRQVTGATDGVTSVHAPEEVSVIIEGVTIKDGYNGVIGGTGGGLSVILADQTSFTLRDCEVRENGGSVGSHGGAISISHDPPFGFTGHSEILIEDCLFADNTGFNTGGIYWGNAKGEMQIRRSKFTGNSCASSASGGKGSIFYMNSMGKMIFDQVQVSNNVGTCGYALNFFGHSETIAFKNSSFSNNNNVLMRFDKSVDGKVIIENSTLANQGTLAIRGGAWTSVSQGPMSLEITNSTLANNGAHLEIQWVDLKLANNVMVGASTNCSATGSTSMISLGGNVATGSNSCGFVPGLNDQFEITDPILTGPLDYQGGSSTQSYLLAIGSPALGSGVAEHCPAWDQNNKSRPGPGCDSGSVEMD